MYKQIITISLSVIALTVPCAVRAETYPWFKSFASKIQTLVTDCYPKTEVTLTENKFRFEFDTRNFMIHYSSMVGDWGEAKPVEGPNRKGILGEIEVGHGRPMLQFAVPESHKDTPSAETDYRYFVTLYQYPYSAECDCHLSSRLSYPRGIRGVSGDFIEKYRALINNFSNSVGADNSYKALRSQEKKK